MPTAMNQAFWSAMLKVTKDPSSLDATLADLDKTQATAYTPSLTLRPGGERPRRSPRPFAGGSPWILAWGPPCWSSSASPP